MPATRRRFAVSKVRDLVPTKLQIGTQAVVLRAVLALPRPLRRSIAGKPLYIDGEELALDAQLLLRLQRLSGNAKLTAETPERARAAMHEAHAMVVHHPISDVEVT